MGSQTHQNCVEPECPYFMAARSRTMTQSSLNSSPDSLDSFDPDQRSERQKTPRRGASRLQRWLLWIGAIALLVLVIVGGVIALLLRRAEPMLRASLIDTLQKRFNARVELDEMHVAVLDGFQVEGSGLRIWLPAQVTDIPATLPKPSAASSGKVPQSIATSLAAPRSEEHTS